MNEKGSEIWWQEQKRLFKKYMREEHPNYVFDIGQATIEADRVADYFSQEPLWFGAYVLALSLHGYAIFPYTPELARIVGRGLVLRSYVGLTSLTESPGYILPATYVPPQP